MRQHLPEIIEINHGDKITAVPNPEVSTAVERPRTVMVSSLLVAAVDVDPAIGPLEERLV